MIPLKASRHSLPLSETGSTGTVCFSDVPLGDTAVSDILLSPLLGQSVLSIEVSCFLGGWGGYIQSTHKGFLISESTQFATVRQAHVIPGLS